jgi:hypothetical protein
MGCWKEIDGFTNMPIWDNSPVKWMLVRRITDDNYLDHLDPFYYFKPLTPLFSGEYDDYGGVDNIPEGETSMIQEFLSKIKTDEKTTIKFGHNVNGDGVGSEWSIRVQHRDKMDVLIWMIHEDTWELIKDIKESVYDLDTRTYSYPRLEDEVRRVLDPMVATAVADRATLDSNPGLDTKEFCRLIRAEQNLQDRLGRDLAHIWLQDSLFPKYASNLVDLKILHEALDAARRKLVVHQDGHQDWGLEVQTQIAEHILKKVKEIKEEWGYD